MTEQYQKGDVVKFIDPDPEFAEDYGMVGTVWFILPPTKDDPRALIQVDYHTSYGVHLPEQLEKLM